MRFHELTKDLAHSLPDIPRYWLSILVVQVDCIHELAVYIKLLMKRRAITNPNRTAASISLQMI
jgi:hypothetical protein